MESVHKILVLVVILATASSALARVFLFDDGQPLHRERSKRQASAPQGPRSLGYDADDILRPPGLEPAESRYPWSHRSRPHVDNPAVVWGTVKQGEVVDRPRVERSPAERQEEEEEEEEEEEAAGYSQEGHSYHHVPASIYSFVKTDPHGNFKWGVHRGAPRP